jgi:hypothetical protein
MEEKGMIEGGCLCGRVRYEIDGRISRTWLCHCQKCRKTTGSAFHASAVCRPDQFRLTKGEDEIAAYEDTPGYRVRFCRTCGSPAPSYLENHGLVFLHVGTLEGDPDTVISHHIFVGSKAPWFEIRDELPAHHEHAPGGGGEGEGEGEA